MALQPNRILRFIMVISVVVLTIFIYASYYSNPTMTIPTRIHSTAALISTVNSNIHNSNNNLYNNNNNNNILINKNSINSNRISANNINIKLDDKNDGDNNGIGDTIIGDVKIGDNNRIGSAIAGQNTVKTNILNNNNTNNNNNINDKSNNNKGNISYNNNIDSNSYNFKNNKLNMINDNNINNNEINNSNNNNNNRDSFGNRQSSNWNADTVKFNSVNSTKFLNEGPVSNIQNFIKNADKILKNLTVAPIVNLNSTSQQQKPQIKLNQQQQQQSSQLGKSSQLSNHISENLMPQSPSSTAIRIVSQQQMKSLPLINNSNITLGNLTSQQQFDLSNGIPTGQLYESGHLDVNPNLCPNEGDQIRLLIVITSAPSHREARLSIRQTWGHYGTRRDIAIAFILGRTLNPIIEESLNNENYLYGDLIRGRFIDSYNNLTLKTISILEWVDKQCSFVNYVLKTDDDMFINVPKLLSFIDKQNQNNNNSNKKNIIYGRLAKKWKPIRNKKSKYYVAPGQFSQQVFPQFTTGPAYLMSSDIIHDLFIKSLEQTYLKLEDVFTTGIVAQLLNIKRVHVNEFLNRRIAFNPCNIRKAISVHMIKSNEQFDLWKKLLDTSTKCK
ncbi:putative uncharacterized protein DDB_G0282133 [Condylostylus longicornis]|uniref:putative uncharacterized protein DDB_G0282133 n=1 Tax=Condylostylus longicornis TaxID=2530218 RepID=UPI00244DA583|nr:putative uncharacterized protein DDB_G0282133 [Condylostylus longicornis]XP_055384012.1 putative uncharacterized protein DDB_G0282133 [Condylostylus longicornis]XP_055384013.1 putative uncharacterized protein DDB_G0282133 [Condylostylus longicornis]XP_055384015.1 putative uncharacterized protein DDB_G0282133 [Condylostylus longicornis]XP_055384016.1 putative uncharacterized protein DDB_G0282133 [Condylostylus longicornis]XP_055384017.1 putative uncharacterized protein DDB_G0282133 [Condylos